MLVEGAIPALAEHLSSASAEMRSHACRVLGEMAFRNPQICYAVTSHEEVVPQLVAIIANSSTTMGGRCDACLVLNNCAAFCEASCCSIVGCTGLLDALKEMAVCSDAFARGIAVGVFNCLSRCPSVKQELIEANIVEEALAPVLRQPGSGERHEAMLARTAMAIANLTGNVTLSDLEHDASQMAITTTVKILGFALDGRSWAGIHFAPYSVVYPLNNLAANPDNRSRLVECGLLELLARCMNDWQDEAHHADETLQLCLELAAHLKGPWEWQQRMREGGVVRALQKVRDRSRGESQECGRRAEELLDDLLQGHMAVWASQHQRLGAGSPLHSLDFGVLDIISQAAFGIVQDETRPAPELLRLGVPVIS